MSTKPPLSGVLTISRNSSDVVRIQITDDLSGATFAVVSMTPEAFGLAITGLSEQAASIEIRGLDVVGRRRITERRSIECPLDTYDRGALSAWLAENAKEDGWRIDTHLGSQSSVTRRDGKTVLNYRAIKYVDAAA